DESDARTAGEAGNPSGSGDGDAEPVALGVGGARSDAHRAGGAGDGEAVSRCGGAVAGVSIDSEQVGGAPAGGMFTLLRFRFVDCCPRIVAIAVPAATYGSGRRPRDLP